MSRLMTKPTVWLCAQQRLRSAWASTRSDQSLPCALIWLAKDPRFLHADSEDSDQTGRMPRLVWVFAGRTATLLVLLWGEWVFTGRTGHFVGFVMRRLKCIWSSHDLIIPWTYIQVFPSKLSFGQTIRELIWLSKSCLFFHFRGLVLGLVAYFDIFLYWDLVWDTHKSDKLDHPSRDTILY